MTAIKCDTSSQRDDAGTSTRDDQVGVLERQLRGNRTLTRDSHEYYDRMGYSDLTRVSSGLLCQHGQFPAY